MKIRISLAEIHLTKARIDREPFVAGYLWEVAEGEGGAVAFLTDPVAGVDRTKPVIYGYPHLGQFESIGPPPILYEGSPAGDLCGRLYLMDPDEGAGRFTEFRDKLAPLVESTPAGQPYAATLRADLPKVREAMQAGGDVDANYMLEFLADDDWGVGGNIIMRGIRSEVNLLVEEVAEEAQDDAGPPDAALSELTAWAGGADVEAVRGVCQILLGEVTIS